MPTEVRDGRRYEVPLNSGRRAVVVVTSGGRKKVRTAVGYFFGPYEPDCPITTLDLRPHEATSVSRFTWEAIRDGKWRLISSEPLDASVWVNPVFGNPGAGYRRIFCDVDPGKEIEVSPAQPGDELLPRDGLAGPIFMEEWLDNFPSPPTLPGVRILDSRMATVETEESGSEENEDQCVMLEVPMSGIGVIAETIDDLLTTRFEDSIVDEYDGYERDEDMVRYYLYGPSAKDLASRVATYLAGQALPSGASLVLRAGPPGSEERRTPLA